MNKLLRTRAVELLTDHKWYLIGIAIRNTSLYYNKGGFCKNTEDMISVNSLYES